MVRSRRKEFAQPRRLERDVTKTLRRWCAVRGVVAIKLSTMKKYGSSGWPDYLLLARGESVFPSGERDIARRALGRCAFVELKREGEQPTVLQHEKLSELRRMGFCAVVWEDKHRSLPNAQAVLARALGVES